MKRYEKYTPSGLQWISQIPRDWKVQKNKVLFNEEDAVSENGDEPLLSLSQYTGVTYKNGSANYGMREAESKEGYRIVKKGNIVMNIMLAWNGSTAVSPYDGIISPAYAIYSLKQSENERYFHYLFRIPVVCQYFELYSTGLIRSRLRLYSDDFLRLYSIVPPRAEQDQIVRYLDWQVSKINRLIAAKRRQIKIIREQRQTAIDIAVTRGIDNAPLKKSGVAWVEKIPQHWKMVYAKKLFYERKDKAFAEDEQLTASQKYGVISQNKFMALEGRRVTVVLTGADILKHVGIGDFVISMRSFQGGLEYSYVEGKISSAYVMIIPYHDKVYDEYFKWLLKSTPYIKALQGTSDLVRDGQALRFANFVKVYLPEIPLEEQRRIAEYINELTKKDDCIIPRIEEEICSLQELRTRLISDVVTGQIDVRDIEIPDFEYISETDDNGEDTDDEESDDLTEEEV